MPCGPICPASDALCIAGFKTGWRLWPPTRASFPGRGQATHKKTHWKGNQNQPYLIQLGEGLPTVFPPSFSRFYCPVFLLPPTVSDTVGYTLCYAQLQQNYSYGSGSNAAFSSLLLSPPLPRFLSSPNPIRYSWRTRASDLQAPSLNCLVVHPLDPPKIQNPESKIQNLESKIQNSPIQNPKSKLFRPDFGDFGFWILDRYVAILYVRPPTPQILDFGGGFWILDFGFWISDFGFCILDFGFWILDFGFWILDFGFQISDFGFWILERYVAFLFVQILDFGFWISDFGFWILDFGFWILDFGIWISDFGSWILDFGFWILDFGFRISDFGFWSVM